MTTAHDILGVHPEVTPDELDRAFAARQAKYDEARVADLPPEFRDLAARRRAELAAAYQELRPAPVASPVLEPAVERRRDRETLIAVVALVLLALTVPATRGIARPTRTVAALGADEAARTAAGARDFTIKGLDGQDVSLSDYQGKVVVINFWATWCPPCVREIPRLVRVAERYDDAGLVMLGINTTFQDDVPRVRQFVQDQAISYPVLLDVDGAASDRYPSRLMPTTYLIGRDGKIIHTKVGEVDEATLAELVESALQH